MSLGSQFANTAYNDSSTYNYDNTNQLAGADHSAIGDEGYTYDANGNRTNTGYQTGSNNQLSSDGTYNYTYDNEGNLKTRTEIATGKVRAFTWDYRNRLTGVTDETGGTVTQQVSYTYDALNQRLAKTVGTQTTRFVYDRGNVYLEFSGTSTTPITRYLYGPMVDQVLAQESQGNTTWMLTDHLGSVRDLVNNDGAVANHFTYDSFGQVVGSTGTVDTRYKFTGREYDGETGLYYYRARYFDAGVGRFIGQDPIGFNAGDSNLYRYVGNSPSNHTDPSGLLVDATFTLSTGSLKIVDRNTGNTTITRGLFSGAPDRRNNFKYENEKGTGPIPRGQYEILLGGYDNDFQTYWFRLDRVDNNLRDDLNGFTGRGNYRLHPGSVSEGCITLDKARRDDWRKLYLAIAGTITEEVSEKRELKSLIVSEALGLAKVTKYGDLTVKQ